MLKHFDLHLHTQSEKTGLKWHSYTHTRTHTEKLKTGLRSHCCWSPHLSDLVSLTHRNTHYLTTFCVTFDLPFRTIYSWQDTLPQRVWDVSEEVSYLISELGEEYHDMGISYVPELNINSKGTANTRAFVLSTIFVCGVIIPSTSLHYNV